MKRRSFLAALAALPVVGRLLASREIIDWLPPGGLTDKHVAYEPDGGWWIVTRVTYDLDGGQVYSYRSRVSLDGFKIPGTEVKERIA